MNSQKNTFCTGFSTEFVLNTQTIWITNFRLHLRNPGGFWKYSRFSDRRPHLKFIGILQQKCTILIRNLTCGKKVSFAKIHLKIPYATKYFRRFAYLYFSNVRYLTSNWRLEVCKRLRRYKRWKSYLAITNWMNFPVWNERNDHWPQQVDWFWLNGCSVANSTNLIVKRWTPWIQFAFVLWKLPLFWTKLWKLSKIAHFALHEILGHEIGKSWEHWLIGWSIEIYLLFSICEPDARLIFAAISVTLSLQDQWVNFSHIQWQHSD